MINKPNDFSKNSDRFFMMIEDKYQTALIDYDYNYEMYINFKAKNIRTMWFEEQLPEEMFGRILEKCNELKEYADKNCRDVNRAEKADFYVSIGKDDYTRDYYMPCDEKALAIAYELEQIIIDRFPVFGQLLDKSREAAAGLEQKEGAKGNSKKLKI